MSADGPRPEPRTAPDAPAKEAATVVEPTTTPRRGRRGDGTIYTTKDGRLRAAVTVRDALTGEPVRRYLSARTDAELRRKLREARAEAAPVGRTPTVAQWCERWLRLRGADVRPATLAVYRIHVRHHITPAIGTIELGRLVPSEVERLTGDMLAAGLAPATAAMSRRVLVMALGDAARDGIIPRNVAQLARPPRMREPERRALSPAEVRTLLEAAEGEPLGPFVALAVATGLRRGELLALRWSDVSDDTLTVARAYARAARGGYAVSEPKTRKARRTIALPSLARAALEAQRARQDAEHVSAGSAWQDRDGLVFTDSIGRPQHPETVTTAFRALVSRSGLGHLRLHDLRHTTATLALAAGVPVLDVSEMLGHSSAAVTLSVYGHATEPGPRRVADAMDRALQ